MKRILLSLLLILAAICVNAQVPQGFTYQAVVSDEQGKPIENQKVRVRISLLDSEMEPHYVEVHTPITSVGGLFTIIVGEGSPVDNKNMAESVDWSKGTWYIKSEIDPTGGGDYLIISIQRLMSVPYALFAGNVQNMPILSQSKVRSDGSYDQQYIDSLYEVLTERLNSLERFTYNHVDEGKSSNLYDYRTATVGKFIHSGNGSLATPSSEVNKYAVSDFIPVDGRNIITNARNGHPAIASMNVYDKNKVLLRIIHNNRQYLYHDGDAYLRISYYNYTRGQANYGTDLLPFEEYYTNESDYDRLSARIDSLENLIGDYLSSNSSTNLYNYRTASVGKYLGNAGQIAVPSYNLDKFGVSDYINVNGRDIITNSRKGNGVASMAVYDSSKTLLRVIMNNQQYTYQPGDSYIRICFTAYMEGQANYGTELLPYEDYFESGVDIQTRINSIYGQPAISWIDDDFTYSNTSQGYYNNLHSWCLEHNVRPDIAFIPGEQSDASDIRVSTIKSWESDGFHILMHPVHSGWYTDATHTKNLTEATQHMITCVQKFNEFGLNYPPIVVYPGSSGEDSEIHDMVSNYVECGICWNNKGDVNHLTEHHRYGLRRLNIQLSATNTKSEIKEFIRQGVENGDWIILGCHVYRYEISDVLDETSMTTANLFDIISYANSLCPIRPTSAVWRERKFLFDINGR